jgi:hypothetical protein
MHEALQRDRQLLASNQLHELRYEDLIQDPLATLSAAYARLNLGDVEPMAHALAAHLPDINRYQVNSYRISTQLKGEIARECADFFRTYHYCPETGAALPIPAG